MYVYKARCLFCGCLLGRLLDDHDCLDDIVIVLYQRLDRLGPRDAGLLHHGVDVSGLRAALCRRCRATLALVYVSGRP